MRRRSPPAVLRHASGVQDANNLAKPSGAPASSPAGPAPSRRRVPRETRRRRDAAGPAAGTGGAPSLREVGREVLKTA